MSSRGKGGESSFPSAQGYQLLFLPRARFAAGSQVAYGVRGLLQVAGVPCMSPQYSQELRGHFTLPPPKSRLRPPLSSSARYQEPTNVRPRDPQMLTLPAPRAPRCLPCSGPRCAPPLLPLPS